MNIAQERKRKEYVSRHRYKKQGDILQDAGGNALFIFSQNKIRLARVVLYAPDTLRAVAKAAAEVP